MKRLSSVVLLIGIFGGAVHCNQPIIKTEPALVEVFSVPGKVTNTGAVPITLEEVVKASGLVDPEDDFQTPGAQDRMDSPAESKETEISKRIWSSETTTEAPHHGWGWGGWGGGEHGPALGLVGPFAFQLGAYYNPYLPQHSTPAYSSNSYGSSPSYGGSSYTTPAPSYGSSYTTPAPYHGSSYSAPAPSYGSSSYSAPSYGSSSYGSSSYSAPASPSYSPPSYGSSSYSAPASPSYSPPSYGSSYSAPSYSAPSSYGSAPHY